MARGQLTPQQLRYTEYVAGGLSEREACIKASYSEDFIDQIIFKMRRNPRIIERIKMLQQDIEDETIMSEYELMKYWSDSIRDPITSVNQKIEMSKLLAKSKGMFVDRKQVETTNKQQPVMIVPATVDWSEYWEERNG